MTAGTTTTNAMPANMMPALSPREQALLEPIEAASILAHTLAWAAVNSGSGNLAGLKTMAGLLADAFAVLPGTVTLVDPAPVTAIGPDGCARAVAIGQHLVVRVRPEAPRRVLLTGHMDTVFAADDPFQTCRWLDDDTLNGPGTADMKGGLALMLAGLTAFEATVPTLGYPTLGYDVLINADEETGSLGSASLIAELAAGKLAALTYEPPLPADAEGVCAMAGDRPGSGNYTAVVRGRSAHAGRNPEEGRNALVAAADLALRLKAAARRGLAINPAKIEGGGPVNRVPELAVLRFNLRPATPADAAEAEALLAALTHAVAAEHDVTIDLHGALTRPPKRIDAAAEALFALVGQAARDLGQAWRRVDTGGVCDGNNIAACGVPVIDTMGAHGGAIHSSEEFLCVSSLGPRARLTALALHRLAQT